MMKKYVLLAFSAALFLSACQDKDYLSPVLHIGDPMVITAPADGSSYVLTAANADAVFATFTWTAADFGFQAGVSYSIELDRAGNNFADATVLGTTTKLTLEGITNAQINNILAAKGLPGEEESLVEFRVAAKVNPDVPVVYSAPITLKITPFTVVIIYPQLQVPGSYQGWDPANNTTVIFSARSDNKYEGYINFPNNDTEFKYTLGTSWTTNWGDNGADGTLEPNGDNIKAALAGVYKLNVNLNDKTHTYTRTDWGLIGSATPDGWNSDQNMTFDAAANKWTITLDLAAGEIKFRANDDWGINLGDDGADKKMEYGGANISVPEAGNYTVDLFLNTAIYSYKLKKN